MGSQPRTHIRPRWSPNDPSARGRRSRSVSETLATVAGVLGAGVGGLVLVGWALDWELLRRGWPGLTAMNPFTAVVCVAAGLALVCHVRARPGTPWGRIAVTLSLLVAAIGLVKVAGAWMGWELGFDQWLFRSKLTADAGTGANQVAPNTALNCVLLGFALFLVNRRSRPLGVFAQILALSSVIDAMLAVLGYAYGVAELYGFVSAVPMALPTASAFLVLGLGTLCIRPGRGLTALLTHRSTGADLLRRLLPAAIVIPVALGRAWLALERHGAFDMAFGMAMMVVFTIAFLATSIWLNALCLDRSDAERTRVEAQVRRANDELEARVRDRTAELAAANAVLHEELVQRERIQDALARSEAEFRTTFEMTAVGMAQTDPSGRYLRVNRKFCELTGYPAEELLGRQYSEITHTEDRERDAASFQRLVDGDVAEYRSEKRYVRKDGSAIWVNVSAAMLRDAAGGPVRLVAVIEDITERRGVEQANRELNARLELRLKRLAGLRRIDQAITASLDLRVTLNTVLDEAVTQLGVDAAAVLLFDQGANVLSYECGRGFRGAAIARSAIRLGEDPAGTAALERRPVYLWDLQAAGGQFSRTELVNDEAFITYAVVPLIAKGQIKGVLEVFHRSPLPPEPEWCDFLEALGGQAAIAVDSAVTFDQLQRANVELTVSYDATIEGWSRALDLRDKDTEGHARRVTAMAVRLGRAMGMAEPELVHLRRGALLHDIGKMGVPDAILLKNGALTDEEWAIMRRHPVHAFEWLSPIPFLRQALEVPYAHHERWDGTGYPRGLKGDAIPLAARVFAAVDVWDALGSDRPYRPGWPVEKIHAHLRSLAGTHLDPAVVEAFLRLLGADSQTARP